MQQALQGAVVNALGLSEFSAPKGKGKGKQAAKDKPALSEAEQKMAKTCRWEDCRAGRGKATTWGPATCCFACKRAFSQQPPVEKMAEWAFEAMIKEKNTKTPPSGNGDSKG